MGQPLRLHHWQRNFRDAFDYGDPVLHLDASTITASDGDRIETWENLADNDIIVSQSGLLDRPIYRPTEMGGLPALEFNIKEFYNVTNDEDELLAQSSNFHIMAVVRLRALSSGIGDIRVILNRQRDFAGQDRTFWVVHWSSKWVYRNTGAETSLPSNDNSILAPELVGIRADSDEVRMRLQGVQQTSSVPLNSGTGEQPTTIGREADSSSRFWDGWMSEILLYPALLSNEKLEEVETHLINKWGI